MLYIGDDWAEGHHDVVAHGDAGATLARRRLPEGADGIARFHELVASCWGGDSGPDPAQVVVVIEADRGPWVKALAAAGYRVLPSSLFAHPAAALPGDDPAGLRGHHREPGH